MKMAKEKKLMEAQIQLLQEQQKLLQTESELKDNKNEEHKTEVLEENKTDIILEETKIEKKDATFPDPTAEQIKELQEEPKDLEIKKKE